MFSKKLQIRTELKEPLIVKQGESSLPTSADSEKGEDAQRKVQIQMEP